MKIFLFAFFLLMMSLFGPTSLAQPLAEPVLGDERIIFHMNVGDIAVGLFRQIAPQHTEQILKLAKLGAFNGVLIFRLEPGFVAQIQNYANREVPLTPDILSQVKKIPAEFSELHHTRGLLSMARFEDDVNSAETSFSFMLGDAPHLDKKYTIFGRMVAGDSVLHQIELIPRDTNNLPLEPIMVESTEVVTAAQLQNMHLLPAHQPETPEGKLRILFLSFAITAFSATVLTALVRTIFEQQPRSKA